MTDGDYRELLRPQLHFTSRRGWLNDPNGLVYYGGRYHLFYQHNPDDTTWGDMHWGHAESRDLVHWEETGDVLFPDEMGAMYSGSAVVDWQNSSGLQTGDDPPIVLFYTAAGSHVEPQRPYTQCMAYSVDGGDTWQKYGSNPVVPHIARFNRDPKVVWVPDQLPAVSEPSGRWVMALYIQKRDDEQVYALLMSRDLRHWTQFQELTLPGSGECPDLFPLALDGDAGDIRWMFWAADGHYLVGLFEEGAFVPQTDVQRAYCGGAEQRASAYAAQTYSDLPGPDGTSSALAGGRRVQMAWLQGDIPGMPFNQQMAFPVELTLHHTAHGPRLHFARAREIENLNAETIDLCGVGAEKVNAACAHIGDQPLYLRAEIDAGARWMFSIAGMDVTWDCVAGSLTCGDHIAPLGAGGEAAAIEIIVDRCSVEVLADEGRVYVPVSRVMALDPPGAVVTVTGDGVFRSFRLCGLASIWGRDREA